jgi:hypothetical protein
VYTISVSSRTPARDLAACHLVKWHVSVVRHLAMGHGIRFEGQGPRTGLDVVIAQHKSLHNSTVLWPDLPHVHALAE